MAPGHTGCAIIGPIGAPGRTNYTAIGDTTNVAARIESLTKETRFPMLLSVTTHDGIPEKPDAHRLEPMMVVGKNEPLIVCGLK